MKALRIFLRVFGVAVLLLCAGSFYLAMRVGADLPDDPDPDRADTLLAPLDPVGDSLPSASVSPEFAGMFLSTYTFDTTGGETAGLRADTTLPASVSAERIGGRSVSVSIVGVDSRMGENVEHADANHVVTFWLDSGIVEITSIPRDTPCDAGFSGTGRNILANLYAHGGRERYLREVAAIAGVDTIEYWAEVGFSQARGLLELIGFRDNSAEALRVLRSRKAFSTGDFQRSFNQGQFIRQMLLRHFGQIEGFTGNLLVRAGLALVETNLTVDAVDSLGDMLRSAGFPRNDGVVRVSIKPTYYAKLAVFNFTDSLTLGSLLTRIDEKAAKKGLTGRAADSTSEIFRAHVHETIVRAAADSGRSPLRVIARLHRPFQQRIWWQLSDRVERNGVRAEMGRLLADAYDRARKPDAANRVREVVRFENTTFGGETERPMTVAQH